MDYMKEALREGYEGIRAGHGGPFGCVIVKDWHARYQNWDLVLSQLEIMFADRAVS